MQVRNKKIVATVSIEGQYGIDNMHGMTSYMDRHGWSMVGSSLHGASTETHWSKEFEDMLDMLIELEDVQDIFNTGSFSEKPRHFVSPMPRLPVSKAV